MTPRLAPLLLTLALAGGCTCDGVPTGGRSAGSGGGAGAAEGPVTPVRQPDLGPAQRRIRSRVGQADRVPGNAGFPHHLALRCDDGSGRACWLLGQAFERGIEVEASPERAAELYRMSCTDHVSFGCFDALRLRLATEGTPDVAITELPNEDQAGLIRACSGGDPRACARLGRAPRTRDLPPPERDDPLDHRATFLERCALSDDDEACAAATRGP